MQQFNKLAAAMAGECRSNEGCSGALEGGRIHHAEVDIKRLRFEAALDPEGILVATGLDLLEIHDPVLFQATLLGTLGSSA